MEESAADILDNMMNMYNDEVIVESIKTSATRTAIIVSHVKDYDPDVPDMLRTIRKRNRQRRYDIIYGLYISIRKSPEKNL